jgi:hypothetical protein
VCEYKKHHPTPPVSVSGKFNFWTANLNWNSLYCFLFFHFMLMPHIRSIILANTYKELRFVLLKPKQLILWWCSLQHQHIWYQIKPFSVVHSQLHLPSPRPYRGNLWCICTTNRKIAGSIPDGITGILHWHKPSSCTKALRSTQALIGSVPGIFLTVHGYWGKLTLAKARDDCIFQVIINEIV